MSRTPKTQVPAKSKSRKLPDSKLIKKQVVEEKLAKNEDSSKNEPKDKISPSRMIAYINENSKPLRQVDKVSILRIVVDEIGEEAILERAPGAPPGIDIDLNICVEKNVEALRRIYGVVYGRVQALNMPV